jgi:hypothetical protein
VLYVGDCPHYAGALALVERIRGELGIDTGLRTSLIGDQAAAERARFPGSPTVRVDGRDVEPGSPSTRTASLACRLYRHEHGLAGQPADAWVRDALLAAGQADATPEPEQRSIEGVERIDPPTAPVRSFHAEARRQPSQAHPATEPQQPAGGHRGARLLADLAPQRVRPVLARLRPATGQTPTVTIATDQYDGVPGHTPAEPCRVPGGASGGGCHATRQSWPSLVTSHPTPSSATLILPDRTPAQGTATLPADHRRGRLNPVGV